MAVGRRGPLTLDQTEQNTSSPRKLIYFIGEVSTGKVGGKITCEDLSLSAYITSTRMFEL